MKTFGGINDRGTFKHFTNYEEEVFRLKVLDNKQRLEVWDRYHQERAKKQMAYYRRYLYNKLSQKASQAT